MYGESVTVLPGNAGTDVYGDTVAAEGGPRTFDDILAAPRDGDDVEHGIVLGFTLYGFPPGTAIAPGAQIQFRDATWEVIGAPDDWSSPTSDVGGLVVQIRRTEG